jgi:hypothetical protein
MSRRKLARLWDYSLEKAAKAKGPCCQILRRDEMLMFDDEGSPP